LGSKPFHWKEKTMLPYEKVRPIHEHKLASFAEQAEIARARREAQAGGSGVFGAMAGVVGKSLSAIKSVGSPRKARPAV
jgi:hypothetical protein